MASAPFQFYNDLTALANQGGYCQSPRLSQISSVFLLSACTYLRSKWLWQSALTPIPASEYQQIVAMIETCEYELMTSFMIGSIIPLVKHTADTNLVLLDGTPVQRTDYPELADRVPASWIAGALISLPDMTDTGLFGADTVGVNIGTTIGSNEVQLSIDNLPSHTHTQQPHVHSEIIPSVILTGAGGAPGGATLDTPTPSTTGVTTATNNPTGNDAPHNNIQQSLAVYWYIVAR